jgi:hypothetical protein
MDYYLFVGLATGEGVDTKANREMLVDKFTKVSESVECLHCLADPLHIADDALRNQTLSGPICEFGCFRGGMTCKLSHVAQLLNRRMFVFDSFTGLRESAEYATYDGVPSELGEFKRGQFACRKEEVIENLRKHGVVERCELVEGPIEDTLPSQDIEPSLVFIDVDVAGTAMSVIQRMWGRIQNKKLFTHEACVKGYMEHVCNEVWWWLHFRMKQRPKLGSEELGRVFGLPGSNCLNYFVKP